MVVEEAAPAKVDHAPTVLVMSSERWNAHAGRRGTGGPEAITRLASLGAAIQGIEVAPGTLFAQVSPPDLVGPTLSFRNRRGFRRTGGGRCDVWP